MKYRHEYIEMVIITKQYFHRHMVVTWACMEFRKCRCVYTFSNAKGSWNCNWFSLKISKDDRKEYDKCIPSRKEFEYVIFLKCNFHFQCNVSYKVDNNIQYTCIRKEAISNIKLQHKKPLSQLQRISACALKKGKNNISFEIL